MSLFFLAPTGAQGEGISDLCPCTLLNKAFRMALKEILQHSKESRGVLGQASKQEKQAGK